MWDTRSAAVRSGIRTASCVGTMNQRAAADTDPGTDDLHSLLRREHLYLQALFEDVVAALEAGRTAWAAAFFTELERSLEAHLWMEERHVFPGLEYDDPTEVRALCEEHAAIRSELSALAAVDAEPLARAAAIGALSRRLSAHAEREDVSVYPWVEANLPEHAHVLLRGRTRERLAYLSARARALRHLSAPPQLVRARALR